jgi:hypothetical protein
MLFKGIYIQHHTEMLTFCQNHLRTLRLMEKDCQWQLEAFMNFPELLSLVEDLRTKIALRIEEVLPQLKKHEEALAKLAK